MFESRENVPKYWLNLFTGTTWMEFLQAGGTVTGFRESRWKTVKKIKPGDYLLCYVIGISRFIGVCVVTSEAYLDYEHRIWSFNTFPARLRVRPITTLEPEIAVPFSRIKNNLLMYQRLKNHKSWGNLVKGSPREINKDDGNFIVNAIFDAKQNPQAVDYNKRKFMGPKYYLRIKS